MAMVGGRVTAPTLDGDREVEIPAGTQPGHAVTLDGLGLPLLRGRFRGTSTCSSTWSPRKLSREQRNLAQRLHESLEE